MIELDHAIDAASFGSYLAVGAVGTGAHYILMVALIEGARFGPVPAASCGFALGALVNYAMNYRYTFRSREPHARSLPKFLVVALLGAAANAVFVGLGVRWLGVHYIWAQLCATGVVVTGSYLGNRAWAFGSQAG